MKRLLACLLCLLCLCPAALGAAESNLIIGVMEKSDSLNLPAEKVYFAQNPKAQIEYQRYVQGNFQLEAKKGNVPELDLVIVSWEVADLLVQQGLVMPLDELGIEAYPDELIDVSRYVMWDDRLYALPYSIGQQFWLWREEMAEKAQLQYPLENGTWTWEDYLTLSQNFPMDTDQDGRNDLYLMSGARSWDIAAFQNANLNLLRDYRTLYPEKFADFVYENAALIRQTAISDALLPLGEEKRMDRLIENVICNSPLLYLASTHRREALLEARDALLEGKMTVQRVDGQGSETLTVEELNTALAQMKTYRILPLPAFEDGANMYLGDLYVCMVLKNAPHPDQAAAFLKAMISDEALNTGMLFYESRMLTKAMPEKLLVGANDAAVEFMDTGSYELAVVTAGRSAESWDTSLVYTDEEYQEAQCFREKLTLRKVSVLSVDTREYGKIINKWYREKITDDEMHAQLTELMTNALLGE